MFALLRKLRKKRIEELNRLMKEIEPKHGDHGSTKSMRTHEKGDHQFRIDDRTDYTYYDVDFLQ